MKNIFIITIMYLLMTLSSAYALDDAVAYYSFDGREGNKFHSGVIGDQGKLDGSLKFDGVNDHIITNFSQTNVEKLSFGGWIKTSSSQQITVMVMQSDFNGNPKMLGLDILSGKPRIMYRGVDGGAWEGLETNEFVNNNEWNHIYVTKENNNIKVYINGQFSIEKTMSNSLSFSNDDLLRIGHYNHYSSGNLRYFNGNIDDLSIYDRILTSQEILELYNDGNGKTAKEVAEDFVYYSPMDSLTDISTQNSPITNNGATIVDGHLGKAFEFDGNNDYVEMNSNEIDVLNSFSCNLWVKLNSLNGYLMDFSEQNDMRVYLDSNKIKFRQWTGSAQDVMTPTLSTNRWYNVLFIKDKNEGMKIYLDGDLEDFNSFRGDGNMDTGKNVIGRRDSLNGFNLDGNIDEVSCYNRVLTPEEISELYNNGNGKKAPEVAKDFVFYNDMSGNINNNIRQINEGLVQEGILGTSWSLDGTTDYLRMDNEKEFTSLSLWIKPLNSITTSNYMGLFGLTSSNNNGIRLGSVTSNVNNEIITIVDDGNSNIFYWDNSDISSITTEWNNIVLNWEDSNNNYRLYYNGEDKGLANKHGNPSRIKIKEIGRFKGSPYFNGKIDEVAIYDRVLTPQEISELYNNGNGFNPYTYVEPIINETNPINNETNSTNPSNGNTTNPQTPSTDSFVQNVITNVLNQEYPNQYTLRQNQEVYMKYLVGNVVKDTFDAYVSINNKRIAIKYDGLSNSSFTTINGVFYVYESGNENETEFRNNLQSFISSIN